MQRQKDNKPNHTDRWKCENMWIKRKKPKTCILNLIWRWGGPKWEHPLPCRLQKWKRGSLWTCLSPPSLSLSLPLLLHPFVALLDSPCVTMATRTCATWWGLWREKKRGIAGREESTCNPKPAAGTQRESKRGGEEETRVHPQLTFSHKYLSYSTTPLSCPFIAVLLCSIPLFSTLSLCASNHLFLFRPLLFYSVKHPFFPPFLLHPRK